MFDRHERQTNRVSVAQCRSARSDTTPAMKLQRIQAALRLRVRLIRQQYWLGVKNVINAFKHARIHQFTEPQLIEQQVGPWIEVGLHFSLLSSAKCGMECSTDAWDVAAPLRPCPQQVSVIHAQCAALAAFQGPLAPFRFAPVQHLAATHGCMRYSSCPLCSGSVSRCRRSVR